MEEDPHHQMLSVDAINMDLDNWIFVCKETSITGNNHLDYNGQSIFKNALLLTHNMVMFNHNILQQLGNKLCLSVIWKLTSLGIHKSQRNMV